MNILRQLEIHIYVNDYIKEDNVFFLLFVECCLCSGMEFFPNENDSFLKIDLLTFQYINGVSAADIVAQILLHISHLIILNLQKSSKSISFWLENTKSIQRVLCSLSSEIFFCLIHLIYTWFVV